MLLGQEGGGHEHRDLLAVLHRLERGPDRHLGLAEADVATDQAIHRRGVFHVGLHVGDRRELVGRLLVGEAVLELLLPRRVGRERGAALLQALLVQDHQLLGDLGHRRPHLGLGALPGVAAEAAEAGAVAAGVVADGVDLVGGDVEAIVALVLEQQVVAVDAADGPLHHAAVAGDAVLVVDDVVALLQVVEEALGVATPGPGLAVGPAAPGEVGLGQQRHLDAPQHRTALERGDVDLGVDALAGQQVAEAGGRSLAVGADHHPVALAAQRLQAGEQPAAVADHGIPPRALHLGRVGAVGHAHDVPRARLRVGEQAVELEVQAGEAVVGRAILGRPPRHRQRRRQVGLFRQQVGGPVAHAAGLAQQDLGVVAHDVDQRALVAGEPRQPRLHAVEHQALRQALPLLAAPRLEAHEPLGPLADLVGGQQLAAGEQQRLVEVVGRPLVGDRELGEPVDLVAPQIDAQRPVGGRREHVDDRAPYRQLAPVLDHLLAPVPGGHEVADQVVAVDLHAGSQRDGRHVVDVRAQALHERPNRGDDHVGRLGLARLVAAVPQSPQHPEPPAHGLDARAHPLERQGLPGREQLDPVVAEEDAEVARQPLGFGRRRNGQNDGPPLGEPRQPGRDQRPRRLGHGQGRRAAAEHLRERGFVAQRGRQVDERAGCGRAGRAPEVVGAGVISTSTLPGGYDSDAARTRR